MSVQFTPPFIVVLVVATLFGSTSTRAFQELPVVTAKRDLSRTTVLSENDLSIQKWPADKVPARSFATTENLIGRELNRDVPAGEAIDRSYLANTQNRLPGVGKNQRIISLPVSISTKFDVGEKVRLIRDEPEGEDVTVVDQVRVFHIGEPETIQQDGKTTFIRFVTVLVSVEQVEKIAESVQSKKGVHVLQPIDLDQGNVTDTAENSANSNSSKLEPTNANPNEQPTGNTKHSPGNNTHSEAEVGMTYEQRLRTAARKYDDEAESLEEMGKYEQADLIRQAAQKLREAARLK